MAKTAGQKLKLLTLARLLWENTDEDHGLSVQEMIDSLEANGIAAERKSIYDDLESLRTFGLDIECHKSKKWDYYIASRTFQTPELKLLVDAVQSSRFITLRKSNELIKKLESLTSRQEASALQRQVYVADRIKTMNESIYYNVDTLHAAIAQNRQVTFHYFSWTSAKKKQLGHGGARYRVSPCGLLWNDDCYYLVAWEEERELTRHYRVDKMQNIAIMPEKRSAAATRAAFDPALYMHGMFGMFGGVSQTVRLRFDEHLAGIVLDRFGNDVFLKSCEGAFEFSAEVVVSPQFFGWVFGFGKDARILAPDAVVTAFRTYADETLAQYTEQGGELDAHS